MIADGTVGTRGRRGRAILLIGLVAVLALVVVPISLLVARDAPDDDSAEAGFLRDMMVHHAQAVEMALIIRDRTADEQLRFVATDILLAQQHQIGMMDGWLKAWDLSPNTDGAAMAWMGHPVEGLMPGMATQEQIDLLRTLPVEEAEVLFLQLMTTHHESGVEMAQAYLDRGDDEDVSAFARNVIQVQDLEIETMNAMLEQRGVAADAPMPGATPSATPEGSHEGH